MVNSCLSNEFSECLWTGDRHMFLRGCKWMTQKEAREAFKNATSSTSTYRVLNMSSLVGLSWEPEIITESNSDLAKAQADSTLTLVTSDWRSQTSLLPMNYNLTVFMLTFSQQL